MASAAAAGADAAADGATGAAARAKPIAVGPMSRKRHRRSTDDEANAAPSRTVADGRRAASRREARDRAAASSQQPSSRFRAGRAEQPTRRLLPSRVTAAADAASRTSLPRRERRRRRSTVREPAPISAAGAIGRTPQAAVLGRRSRGSPTPRRAGRRRQATTAARRCSRQSIRHGGEPKPRRPGWWSTARENAMKSALGRSRCPGRGRPLRRSGVGARPRAARLHHAAARRAIRSWCCTAAATPRSRRALPDLLGDEVEVLCVKGSGWDMADDRAGRPAGGAARAAAQAAHAATRCPTRTWCASSAPTSSTRRRPTPRSRRCCTRSCRTSSSTTPTRPRCSSLVDQPDGDAICARGL